MSSATSTQRSRTIGLVRGIRSTAAFRQLFAMESAAGLVVPRRRDGAVFLELPFFGIPPARGKDGQGAPLYPPFATLTLDWHSARVVGYRDLAFEGLWETREPVGTFPHEAVARMRRSEYLRLRERLFVMYDEMFALLANGGVFTDVWTGEFSRLLGTLIEPALVPYYRELAPRFIDRFLASEMVG